MSEQGFCSKCGYAYLSNNHLANCFQSTQFDAGDRIKTLEAERDTLIERVLAHERIEMDLMAQRDALKARVGKLVYALEVTENEIGTVQDSSSQQSWRQIVKAALAEDGDNK